MRKRQFGSLLFLLTAILLNAVAQNALAESPSASLEKSSSEPVLTIGIEDKKIPFTRKELLARPDVEIVKVQSDPTYRGQREYHAVRISHLFAPVQRGIAPDSMIEFRALDGFSAAFTKDRLLNDSPKNAIAYLAIEPAGAKWPLLAKSKKTAGPFYLIWVHPELSQISTEEWPFQLAGFQVAGSMKKLFPKIFPSDSALKDPGVAQGFETFKKSCFACHSINGQGSSQIGPDLNIPMNPTHYFQLDALKKYIRNPKSVRVWPELHMPGFAPEVISDLEIENLLKYLKQLDSQR
jgi:mono/diheme cytochrome c family protein